MRIAERDTVDTVGVACGVPGDRGEDLGDEKGETEGEGAEGILEVCAHAFIGPLVGLEDGASGLSGGPTPGLGEDGAVEVLGELGDLEGDCVPGRARVDVDDDASELCEGCLCASLLSRETVNCDGERCACGSEGCPCVNGGRAEGCASSVGVRLCVGDEVDVAGVHDGDEGAFEVLEDVSLVASPEHEPCLLNAGAEDGAEGACGVDGRAEGASGGELRLADDVLCELVEGPFAAGRLL